MLRCLSSLATQLRSGLPNHKDAGSQVAAIMRKAGAIGIENKVMTARGKVLETESENPIVTETATVDLQTGDDRAKEGRSIGHQTVGKGLVGLGIDLGARRATVTDGVPPVDPAGGGRLAAMVVPVMIVINGRRLQWLSRDRGFQTRSVRQVVFVIDTT